MKGGIDSPEHWLDAHGDAMFQYALLRLRDRHKAEEAVQETFLAALQARDRYLGGAAVRTWLIGILKHKILDQFRREAREVGLTESDTQADRDGYGGADTAFSGSGRWRARLADWGNPDVALEQQQFWSTLEYCLEHMPARLARIFVIRELMEESSETICADFAITPANLWTLLYRARMGLRQCFDTHWSVEADR